MLSRIYVISLWVTIFPCCAHASSQVVIFGGGSTPNDSQVSIELNTLWISEKIKQLHPERTIHTLYTDGNAAGVDVHRRDPSKNEMEIGQPLARIYNQHRKNQHVYNSSKIAENVSLSNSETVAKTLTELFDGTKPGEDLLLIYQGHGGHNPSNTNKNHFRLWDNTKMTVAELESLMSRANPKTTVRFVLPQCFSGAFTRSIYKEAQVENGLAIRMAALYLVGTKKREYEDTD